MRRFGRLACFVARRRSVKQEIIGTMRDSIESWRPRPLANRPSLSDAELDRLVVVLELRGPCENERRWIRARFDNALVRFHNERDDETRPSIHLTMKRKEQIAATSRHLCGLLGLPVSFDPDVNPVDQMPPALVQAIALESARMAESDPDIPGPNLQIFGPQLQAMANLTPGRELESRECRTPRGHEALTGLIFQLEKIYQDVTGRQAKLSRHPVTGEPGGPLIRFLRESLRLAFKDTPSDEKIAGHHRKINDWRKHNKAA